MSKLVERAYETSRGWLALGHERIPSPYALLVRDREHPDVYDANFAALVRAATDREITQLLEHMDEVFSGSDHRFVFWDAAMPQPLEARLVVDGWQRWNETITLVLEGELRERREAMLFDMRPAASDADWKVIEDLHWLDAQEEVSKGLQPAWPRSVTEAIVRTKRRKTPAVQYFLARVDGVDCAFFSAWPGDNGVGQVEDLYTLPAYRGRGIARALMVACVDDARARGAGTDHHLRARRGHAQEHVRSHGLSPAVCAARLSQAALISFRSAVKSRPPSPPSRPRFITPAKASGIVRSSPRC